VLGCHKSTISRELQRNRGQKGYRLIRQMNSLTTGNARPIVRALPGRLGNWSSGSCVQDWSPEQIAGRLKARENSPRSVMNASICTSMQTNGAAAPWHQHLRSQKKQRKRYSGYIRRGQIPNRISIDKRPKIVASKGRYGDWEVDTIVGARHKGGILSAVERKSKLTRLRKLATKAAAEMKDNTIELLAPLAAKVHTITVDNGKEFCEHQLIATGFKRAFTSLTLMPVGNEASTKTPTVWCGSIFLKSSTSPSSQQKTCNKWKID